MLARILAGNCACSSALVSRGASAANAGEMAETLPELKTGKRTGSTTRKTTSSTTKNKKRKRTSGSKAASKDGVELLRQAMNVRLVRDSEALADAISEKARKGELAYTKAMVGFATDMKPLPEPVKKRRGPTQAQRFANEPQWQGKEEEEGEEA